MNTLIESLQATPISLVGGALVLLGLWISSTSNGFTQKATDAIFICYVALVTIATVVYTNESTGLLPDAIAKNIDPAIIMILSVFAAVVITLIPIINSAFLILGHLAVIFFGSLLLLDDHILSLGVTGAAAFFAAVATVILIIIRNATKNEEKIPSAST